MSDAHDFRSLQRRRVYLGEGLRFELASADTRYDAEAVDMTSEGLGLAVLDPAPSLPAPGTRVTVRATGRTAWEVAHPAIVRHVGRVRELPRVGLALAPDT